MDGRWIAVTFMFFLLCLTFDSLGREYIKTNDPKTQAKFAELEARVLVLERGSRVGK